MRPDLRCVIDDDLQPGADLDDNPLDVRIIDRLAETSPRRALAAPRCLVMLDEPTEGIMPVLVDEMFALFEALRRDSMTIPLVEQNVDLALAIADRAYVLDCGVVVHADTASVEQYCAV